MIQRIQSIFLLLASTAGFCLLKFPFAETAKAVPASTIFQDSLYTIQDNPALLGLFLVGAALALGSIFLFKNRKLQINLSRFSFIANLIGLVLALILFFNDRETLGSEDPNDGIGLYLPIAALVFLLFAMRFISKDEKTVRSMDRLR